jgi:hypothetical protein
MTMFPVTGMMKSTGVKKMIWMATQKAKGTIVEGEEVYWSDDDDTRSALVESADPLYVADGKWQNEAQGQPTHSGSRTISEYSIFLT